MIRRRNYNEGYRAYRRRLDEDFDSLPQERKDAIRTLNKIEYPLRQLQKSELYKKFDRFGDTVDNCIDTMNALFDQLCVMENPNKDIFKSLGIYDSIDSFCYYVDSLSSLVFKLSDEITDTNRAARNVTSML